eukprot:9742161-Lingulodinium_polyedra.AAC.1
MRSKPLRQFGPDAGFAHGVFPAIPTKLKHATVYVGMVFVGVTASDTAAIGVEDAASGSDSYVDKEA